jgi:hypothetical protein
MVWVHVVQDRHTCRALVNTVMNFRVSWNAENFLNSWATISFSRRNLFYGVGWFATFAEGMDNSVNLNRESKWDMGRPWMRWKTYKYFLISAPIVQFRIRKFPASSRGLLSNNSRGFPQSLCIRFQIGRRKLVQRNGRLHVSHWLGFGVLPAVPHALCVCSVTSPHKPTGSGSVCCLSQQAWTRIPNTFFVISHAVSEHAGYYTYHLL